jgi:hypothetical protein
MMWLNDFGSQELASGFSSTKHTCLGIARNFQKRKTTKAPRSRLLFGFMASGFFFHQSIFNLTESGKPGSGKTVLSGSIVDRLKAQNPRSIVCYYLFDSLESHSNNSCDAYRAILSQIVQRRFEDQRLIDLFSFAMYFGSDRQSTASLLEISDLFDVCVYLLFEEEMFLILDGLDVCHDLDSELMPKLCKFGHLYPIKLVLLSRETVKSSVKSLPSLRIVNIGSLNLKDIQLYLRQELGTLVNNRLLPKDLHLDETTHKLARRADGMFLWARLMITYLKLPALLHSDRLTAIPEADMPEGPEQMYERIIRPVASQGQAYASLASYVFMWLIYGQRELTLRELENAVISRKKGGVNEGTRSLEDFPDTVVAVCGGFVEYHSAHSEKNPDSQPVRFIHLSIKEYLPKAPSCNIDRSDGLQGLAILTSSFQANVRLATLCVEYLTYSMPAESLSVTFGSRTCRTNVQLAFPLGNYVVSHWTDHLLATESTVTTTRSMEQDGPGDYKKLVSTLYTFLSQPKVLTTWIEACYIFDRPPPFRNLSEWAASKPQSSWGV